jgi:hypothetical protein
MSEEKIVRINHDGSIDIIKLKATIKCKKCGWIWATQINFDGSFPYRHDKCNRCENIMSVNHD